MGARDEMALFDRMHPRCRAALRDAPFDFRLASMPKTELNHAIGKPRPAPSRFIAWLDREIAAARSR